MKQFHLIIHLLLLSISQTTFSQSEIDKTMDFEVNDMPIPKALLLLADEAKLDIAFSENYFNQEKPISLNLRNQSVENILKNILKKTPIQYKFRDGQVILLKNAPRKFTISGYISDAETGERLISATVFCPKLGTGTLTNEYGFFSLTFPRGQHQLYSSYIGFGEKKTSVSLNKNQRLEIGLAPSIILAEIVVKPDSNRISASFPAMEGDKILNNQMQIMPDLGGEADIMRMISLLPGIGTGADGFGGLSVRGGSNDQNLILLDGVPLYNATHLLGQFSIFNANAIRSIKLLKGGFPARYGGRVSSILDVRTREGNRRNWSAEAGVGMLSANVTVEGPFAQKKGAIFLAGRQTHSNFYLEPLIEQTFFDEKSDEINYDFYDLNGKINFDLTENDRLLFSFYMGGDDFSGKIEEDSLNFDIEEISRLELENIVYSLRWNHIFNNKVFSNTTFTHSSFNSHYRYYAVVNYEDEFEDEFEDQLFFEDYASDIRDWTIKTDWDYIPNPNHHLKFGLGITMHSIQPTFSFLDETDFQQQIDNLNFNDYQVDGVVVLEAQNIYAYVENDFAISPRLRLNAGLRTSLLDSDSGTFLNFEPRLAGQFTLTDKLQINGSITRMVQYLHLLENNNFRTFSNIWLPSQDDLNPQSSWQSSLGTQFINANFSAGIEAYYKKVSNIYSSDFFEQEDTELEPLSGKGYSYGIEFFLRRDFSKTGGWINYTLSKSNHEFPKVLNEEIIGFENIPTQLDSRHQLKLFFYQKLSKNWTITMNWIYNSPLPTTIFFNDNDSLSNTDNATTFGEGRGKTNHRLDLGLSYFLKKPKLEHQFKFSLYNAYNRKNAAFYLVDVEVNPISGDFEETDPQLISLMPILPSIYYGVKF